MDSLELIKSSEHFFSIKNVHAFFGGKTFNPQDLQSKGLSLHTIKQIHSDICVYAQHKIIEADAQWTDQANQVLFIQSADCLPILVSINDSERLLAVHAGWRGVVNNILKKSLLKMNKIKPIKQLDVYIGPHIQKYSFEVSADVADELRSSTKTTIASAFYKKPNTEKYNVCLKSLIIEQIKETNIPNNIAHSSSIDAMTDPTFSSFRKEKSPLRNFSFIVKT